MTSQKYDLDGLLTLREQQKQIAEEYYQQCQQKLRALEEDVEQFELAVQQLQKERQLRRRELHHSLITDSPQWGQLQQLDFYVQGLNIEEDELLAQLQHASQKYAHQHEKTQQAFDQFIEAARALQLVELHYENWCDEMASTKARKTEALMDELATQVWARTP